MEALRLEPVRILNDVLLDLSVKDKLALRRESLTIGGIGHQLKEEFGILHNLFGDCKSV